MLTRNALRANAILCASLDFVQVQRLSRAEAAAKLDQADLAMKVRLLEETLARARDDARAEIAAADAARDAAEKRGREQLRAALDEFEAKETARATTATEVRFFPLLTECTFGKYNIIYKHLHSSLLFTHHMLHRVNASSVTDVHTWPICD